MRLGRTEEAMPVFKSMLPALEARSSDAVCRRNLVVILSNLATFLLDKGRMPLKADLEAALDYATRAVKAAEKEFGPDSEALLRPLLLVARAQNSLDVDSRDALDRRLSLCIRHLGDGRMDTIIARVELGSQLYSSGRFDSAVAALEQASVDLGKLPNVQLVSERGMDACRVIDRCLPDALSKQRLQRRSPSASALLRLSILLPHLSAPQPGRGRGQPEKGMLPSPAIPPRILPVSRPDSARCRRRRRSCAS